MTRAEEYRQFANKVRARAFKEESPILRGHKNHRLNLFLMAIRFSGVEERILGNDPCGVRCPHLAKVL